MKILMVLTSHDQLGNTGKKTGFWLEEFAAPYYVFKDAGAEIVLASPAGGAAPIDPKSNQPDFQTEQTKRYEGDNETQALLASTIRLDTVSQEEFDAVFYPGGHGPLWDLAQDPASIALIEAFEAAHKPMAFVCHAPGVLRAVNRTDGHPLVQGRKVTGFTNSEEAAVGLTEIVPFLFETTLIANGAEFSHTEDWGVHVVTDGHLVTGQNPASSAPAARELLALAA